MNKDEPWYIKRRVKRKMNSIRKEDEQWKKKRRE